MAGIAGSGNVAVVAGAVALRAHSGSTAATGTTGTTPSASSQDARRQAAVRLSGLLARSVADGAAFRTVWPGRCVTLMNLPPASAKPRIVPGLIP